MTKHETPMQAEPMKWDEAVEKLRALRTMCDCSSQPLYVQVLDEALPVLEAVRPTLQATQPYEELRERALEILAQAHEPKKYLVAVDIRSGNVGRQGVAWVETEIALNAISTLLDRLIALEGALEPFAALAPIIDGPDAEEPVSVHTLQYPLRECLLRVGDFKRASTTLSREDRKEGGSNA